MTGAVRMSPDGLVTMQVRSLFYENPADLQHQTSEGSDTDGFFSRASDPFFNQVAKTKEKPNTSSPFKTYSRPSVPPHCCQRWY